jgi:hypothetical protein
VRKAALDRYFLEPLQGTDTPRKIWSIGQKVLFRSVAYGGARLDCARCDVVPNDALSYLMGVRVAHSMVNKPHVFKHRDVTRLVKAARAAGVDVKSVSVDRTGKITVGPTQEGEDTGNIPDDRRHLVQAAPVKP